MLAFNSRTTGRAGVLLHLYGSSPVRAAFVLPFGISHRAKGKFGTVFSTKIPELASDLGYVTDIDLNIGRTYTLPGPAPQLHQRQLRRAGRLPGRDLPDWPRRPSPSPTGSG